MAANQQNKSGDNGWMSWALIIFLFAIGLFPIALVLLFLKLFGSDEEKKVPEKQTSSARKTAPGASKTKTTVKKAMKAPKTKRSNAKILKAVGMVLLAVRCV